MRENCVITVDKYPSVLSKNSQFEKVVNPFINFRVLHGISDAINGLVITNVVVGGE